MDLRNTISFFFDKAQARADEEKAFEKTNLSALKYRPNKRKEGGPILSNSPFCISHSSDTWTSLPANASLCVRWTHLFSSDVKSSESGQSAWTSQAWLCSNKIWVHYNFLMISTRESQFAQFGEHPLTHVALVAQVAQSSFKTVNIWKRHLEKFVEWM